MKVIRLAYGADPSQFGDLRLPLGAGPHPLVITIHGGFWRAAYGLSHIEPAAEALAIAGFATWNVEYRRIGNGGGWPQTFEDVRLAAAYAGQFAEQFRVRTSGMIAVGHSAGGHLALLLGGCRAVSAVVSLAGVADLRLAGEMGLSRGVVRDFLGDAGFAQSSPFELLPIAVPVRCVHGAGDDIVPIEISDRYYAKAKSLGCDAGIVRMENTGHFEIVDPASAQWPVVVETIERISAIVRSSSSSAV